jgi:hypothetical protein
MSAAEQFKDRRDKRERSVRMATTVLSGDTQGGAMLDLGASAGS